MCWEACRQALHGNSPYTQSTIWLFRRGRERIEQGSQPVLLVLFGFALQAEQGEMETWGAAPWAWLLLRQGAVGDLSKGLSLLSAMELAVKMSPVCAQTPLQAARSADRWSNQPPARPAPRNTRRAPAALALGRSRDGDGCGRGAACATAAHALCLCFQGELEAFS